MSNPMMMIVTAMIVKDIQIPLPYSLEGKVKSPLSQIIDSQHCTEEGKLHSLVLSEVHRNVSIENIYETQLRKSSKKEFHFFSQIWGVKECLNWENMRSPKSEFKERVRLVSSWVWAGRVSVHYLLLSQETHPHSPSLSINLAATLTIFDLARFLTHEHFWSLYQRNLANELQAIAFMSIFVVKLNIRPALNSANDVKYQ